MGGDDKVQQILVAARQVLAREGYSATTIRQVAAEAGVSRGLLHYYFANKEELLARVVRSNVETSQELVAAMFASCTTAGDLAAGLCGALRTMLRRSPEFFNLFFESWALARQSPIVAEELQQLYRHFREAMATGLAELAARAVIAPAVPIDGLAAVVTAVVDGLGLQLITEPELIDDPAIWQATERILLQMMGGEA
jgi:AcrR family transcriptional regulator